MPKFVYPEIVLTGEEADAFRSKLLLAVEKRTLVDITTEASEEVSLYYGMKEDTDAINHNEIVLYVKERNEEYAYVSLTRTEARTMADEILRQLRVTEPDNWSDDE